MTSLRTRTRHRLAAWLITAGLRLARLGIDALRHDTDAYVAGYRDGLRLGALRAALERSDRERAREN